MKLSRDLQYAAIITVMAIMPLSAQAADPVDADSFISQGTSVDPSAASNNAAQLQTLMQQTQLQAATRPPADLKTGQTQGSTAMWLLGVGNKTCKEWLDPKSPALGWQGDEWAQGYWTGLNTLNANNHDVGKSLSPQQIIAAIRAKCADDAKTMQIAVSETYVDIMKSGQ
jgi:hypothetical protein